MARFWQYVCCLVVTFSLFINPELASTWSEWWTYEGISGPDFWGLVNPEWVLCSKGKRQSPISIDATKLLFDPYLTQLHVDPNKVSGTLVNTGHDVRLILDDLGPGNVNFTGGPLSYMYRVSEVLFHFGSSEHHGSEHAINNTTFAAEIQIIAFNSELYNNLSHAQVSSNGIVIISLLAQIGSTLNSEFNTVAHHFKMVRYKGQEATIRHLSVYKLLPATSDYITYDGSMTQPGCQETVTWIIMNRPLYISIHHLKMMRELMQGSVDNPKAPISNNWRPSMPANYRPVRTNINFNSPEEQCTMKRVSFYQANSDSINRSWV